MNSLLRFIGLGLLIAMATGCATTQQTKIVESDSGLERANKVSYNATDWFDEYFFRPVAKGYAAVMPDPAEHAITRAFANAREVGSTVNEFLQGDMSDGFNGTGRVLVNSTLGVLGLFEVAESMGMDKREPEDFGQTLAVWGVGSGPYVYIPLLGPSTMRDAPSRVVDYFLDPITYIDDSSDRYALKAADLVQQRAALLQTEEIVSGDRYLFVKDAYLQRREYLISDGEITEEFDDFDTDF